MAPPLNFNVNIMVLVPKQKAQPPGLSQKGAVVGDRLHIGNKTLALSQLARYTSNFVDCFLLEANTSPPAKPWLS